jgi:hypothetical protein
MTKQSYLRMIERNKKRQAREDYKKNKKNQKRYDKAQRIFFKELEKKIQQSSCSSYSSFRHCVLISPNDQEMERLTIKYPFLDFEFITKDDIVMSVTWRLKHE